MFALNEESLANHMGERKIRLDQEDVDRLEKEKAEKELQDKQESELDDMSDIQVVHVGRTENRKKHWNKDGS